MATMGAARPAPPPHDAYSKKAVEWVPLRHHPIFPFSSSSGEGQPWSGGGNIAAWHAESSRLYLWDPEARCVRRLSLRFSDGGPDALLEAASPAEILVPDVHIQSAIHRITINADGSSLILYGSEGLSVMYLYERASSNHNKFTCRTVLVGSQIYTGYNNGLRILHISWHPYSSTHVGILSSDSVFRLFDLSTDLELPEQEYYLQPVEPRSPQNSVPIFPLAFSFGGHHLWDRFSIFVLFNDGSVYVLCPVVPFGSLCSWVYVEGIYEDVEVYGLQSSNPKVVRNSSLAISWLEATFPELADRSLSGKNNITVSRAHPYAPLDASLLLQGPLSRICQDVDSEAFELQNADCEGKAVSFLYSSIGKDSIIVIAWSSGQLQVDALADEVQPLWNFDICPRLRVDSHGHMTGVAMICESSIEFSSTMLSQPLNRGASHSNLADVAWLGHPPPLLRLAIVDLALPKNALKDTILSLYTDPLVPEKFYCLHGGGVDVIALHFLPFSKPVREMDKIARTPSVYPILDIFIGESCSPSICGFAVIDDSYGHSQILVITSLFECIMLETMNWNKMLPLHLDIDLKSVSTESGSPEIISKELLIGPKVIPVSHSTTIRSSADSIEGRSILHHYIKLFHENYVEYAHKVYIELKQHGDHLKVMMDDERRRLHEAKRMLINLENKEESVKNRIKRAFQVYGQLERRLQRFHSLPGANKKPLSRAEREFKLQLDRFADLELDALQSSIDALNSRLERYIQSTPASALNTPRQALGRGKIHASDSQILQLKSSLGVLTNINMELTKKLKLIEHELESQHK